MCCEMICEEQHENWDRERILLHERERQFSGIETVEYQGFS